MQGSESMCEEASGMLRMRKVNKQKKAGGA